MNTSKKTEKANKQAEIKVALLETPFALVEVPMTGKQQEFGVKWGCVPCFGISVKAKG